MTGLLSRYSHWLHTQWPSGGVEPLPDIRSDGSCALPGVLVVGDLTGIPLLKFAVDTGARAVQKIIAEPAFQRDSTEEGLLDLAIVGGGVAGFSAALEANRVGLDFRIIEAARSFSTIANFPRAKPIFTYPSEMEPQGQLTVSADLKESLFEELEQQRQEAGIEALIGTVERLSRKGEALEIHLKGGSTLLARRVILAIGRSGNYRSLGVPGDEGEKVYNRLHDARDFRDLDVLVVGGGDSAAETAIALARAEARVTLSYRKAHFTRPKPELVAALEGLAEAGRLHLAMESRVREIGPEQVSLETPEGSHTLPVDAVFPMLGREAPLDFFRRSGIPIRGEWRRASVLGLLAFLLAMVFLFHWKASGSLNQLFRDRGWFPYGGFPGFGADSLFSRTLGEPGFYYSTAYCLVVLVFGIRRIRRRKSPYVRLQTWTLIAIQWMPLFVLPYFLLPWAGETGLFDSGWGLALADSLFPTSAHAAHGREYWRAVGFILAWPLFLWNVFTSEPLVGWLVISFLQTFVLIPLIVWRWGKGAYCGWICSCGALAETLGDAHREKMPHGPGWNRLNLLGQGILAVATVLLVLRLGGWLLPGILGSGTSAASLYHGALSGWTLGPVALNYAWLVDVTLAGVLGVGLFFWFSGRTWCRFACPLAALMHIYARFSRFRIFAEKDRCISCNVCTSVCHQGIDVMAFASRGLDMEDPQCVRCSACVSSCPTEVLKFGRLSPDGPVYDTLPARERFEN